MPLDAADKKWIAEQLDQVPAAVATRFAQGGRSHSWLGNLIWGWKGENADGPQFRHDGKDLRAAAAVNQALNQARHANAKAQRTLDALATQDPQALAAAIADEFPVEFARDVITELGSRLSTS